MSRDSYRAIDRSGWFVLIIRSQAATRFYGVTRPWSPWPCGFRDSLGGSGAAEERETQIEAAKAELEKVEAGESQSDRWQLEQRIVHAENQLSVSGRTSG